MRSMPTKPIETIAISEFTATCLAALERVRRTGTSIVVSLFYDVSPDGQRFLRLRPPATPAADGKVELVQITHGAAEVRAKLAGTVR